MGIECEVGKAADEAEDIGNVGGALVCGWGGGVGVPYLGMLCAVEGINTSRQCKFYWGIGDERRACTAWMESLASS